MKTGPENVSLGDIARAANVSRMTVSYALRNSSKISPCTRERVQAAAKELGYTPDAKVAATLSVIRNAKSRELLSLGWLNTSIYQDAWRRYRWLWPYLEGAQERCRELGYKLDEIWVNEPGLTERRVSDIFFSRGIQGVIVTPSLVNRTKLHLKWKHFASVSFDEAILKPRLNCVTPDYCHNILLALTKLQKFGYRRIGVCMPKLIRERSYQRYLAGLHYFQASVPEAERVAPRIYTDAQEMQGSSSTFRAWVRNNRLDAIICQHSQLVGWLEEAGWRVPDEIGVVHLSMEDDCADWAGVWQHKREIGAQAVEHVVSMIQHNRFGLPAIPLDTLIPGSWRSGKTLRER